MFLNSACQNSLLKDGKALITAKEPFETLRRGSRIPSWYRHGESNPDLMAENHPS